MHEDVTRILYSQERLRSRVAELGAQIALDHAGEELLVVSVLRGAAIFTADLVRSIDLPCEMDFMAVSSYGMAAESSGEVELVKDLDSPVRGRHVLVVEDILDSGLTLRFLLDVLQKREPASLEVAALLCKRGAQQVEVPCSYIGFECPDEYIVGYGLDYAQKYRNLPYIGVLNPAVYKANEALSAR